MTEFLCGIKIEDQRAEKSSEHQHVCLNTKVAALAEVSQNRQSQCQHAPGDADPCPVAFLIDEHSRQEGSCRCVDFRWLQAGLRRIKTQPAGAKIKYGN